MSEIALYVRPTGEAVAAFTAPAIGLLAMAAANLWAEANPPFNAALLAIGSWIPAHRGIGPYSGMETILLVAWLGTWLALHLLLRGREVRVRPWIIGSVVGIAVAAALVWPPIGELFLKD